MQEQIEDLIGLDASEALMVSAKNGIGIDDVLEAVVHWCLRLRDHRMIRYAR